MDDVEIRAIESPGDLAEASRLIDRVWGERDIVRPALLRALATHGAPVFGAFAGERMVGAQMAFLGVEEGEVFLHSHITGIDPEVQGGGVGLALKRAQRDWALRHGIRVVTWTFDPLVARNAYFNLHKLGATAERFHRDFYGPMEDEINRGDRSDRLEVRWEVASDRVERALESVGGTFRGYWGAAMLLDRDASGSPAPRPLSGATTLLLRVPPDYHDLRRTDPALGNRWRDAVGDALEEAFGAGYRAVGFLRSESAYVLERRDG